MQNAAMNRTPDLPRFRGELAALARLAGPLVGGQLAYMAMGFVDTLMAGHLSARALAAVAVGNSVWSSLNLFLIGVLQTVPAFVSQLDGEGGAARRADIGPLVRQAFWAAQGLAVASAGLAASVRPLLEAIRVEPEIVPVTEGYLRALAWGMPAWALYLVLRFASDGLSATRPTLYFGLLGIPVNIFGNWVLMYGALGLPALGAVGCGWATMAVWWVQALALLVYTARHRRYRGVRLVAWPEAPRREALGRILRVGAPVGVSLFLEGSLFTVVALGVGTLGTETMAGHQVALNFTAVTFMIPLGVGMATTVRVGRAVGRRDAAGIRWAAASGIALAMASQAVSATLMLTLPRPIAAFYTDDPAVIAVAVQLLALAALFQLSDGLQVSAAGALRGLTDTRVPMLITLTAYWLVGLPLGWGLGFAAGLGARGLWIGLIAGLTAAAGLLAWRLWRRLALPAL